MATTVKIGAFARTPRTAGVFVDYLATVRARIGVEGSHVTGAVVGVMGECGRVSRFPTAADTRKNGGHEVPNRSASATHHSVVVMNRWSMPV